MSPFTLLFLQLTQSISLAQVSMINCDSVSRSGYRVSVTFTTADSGEIVVTDTSDYPPLDLVERPVKVFRAGGVQRLVSDLDGPFKYRAVVTLPTGASPGQTVHGLLNVVRSGSAPINAQLLCRVQ